MQVFVEITSSLGRRLTVTVPAVEITTKYQARLQQLAQTMRMDGFRSGKASPQILKQKARIVEQRHGEAVRHEVIEDLVKTSLQNALEQEKLEPAHTPTIQSFKADPGMPLEYSATFEIYPEVAIRNLENVTVEKWNVVVAETDIDHALEQMRNQHTEWDEVQRPAQWGDRLIVSLQGLVDGKPMENLRDENTPLVLQAEQLPPGFSALVGAQANDEITVDLPNPNNPNAATQVAVKVHSVAAPRLPQLDDEFAKNLGVKEGGLTELRAKVHEHMQQDITARLKEKLKVAVVSKFLKHHPIELPKAMIDMEFHRLEKDLRERVAKELQRPATERLPEGDRKRLLAIARRRVALGVLFPAVVKEYSIKLDEARVYEHINRIATSVENPRLFIESLQKNENMMANLRSQVLEEQVIDRLLEQVQFTEKDISYLDAIKEAEKPDEIFADDPFLPPDVPVR